MSVITGELTKKFCGHDPVVFIYTIMSVHISVNLYHSVFDLINTPFACVCKYFQGSHSSWQIIEIQICLKIMEK